MIDLDLTVMDVVKRIPGLSQATISRYTNGVGRNPLIQQAIADALGVTLEMLYAQPAPSPVPQSRRRKTSNGTASSAQAA